MTRERSIVITGASGVVGQAIVRALGGRRPVICLVNQGTVEAEGVEVVRCDISRPQLGLDDDTYRDLVARTEVIVHSAGLTEWGLPAERYQPVNVDGTRHVIALAQRAEAPIHHQSTAFVKALDDDAPMPLRADNVVSNYIRSKREAERLLRESGVPHTVYRPTNLIGDADTGETLRGQIVQLMSDWICRGRAELFPAHPGNLVDIVPQDILAKAVIGAIEQNDLGLEYWVTYGAEAMKVTDALEVCVEFARSRGREITPPRIVHPDVIEEADLARLSPMSRRYVAVLTDVSEVTACSGGILPSSMEELRRRYRIPHVVDRDAYRRSLEYWSVHGG